MEGDSAGGSAIQGRNPITQAILPLRGKILNTERASLDRMMKSDTIESLITAVGGGYGEDFDLNKVRYHKVIIMADADVDGAHIATLNLTLFFRYMRPMITAGYVYVAMPPLYRLKWTKGPHDFVYTDAERDRVLAEGKAAGRQLPKGEGIQRYKGLGEMSYQELWETTMDPDHRILKQVQIEDAPRPTRPSPCSWATKSNHVVCSSSATHATSAGSTRKRVGFRRTSKQGLEIGRRKQQQRRRPVRA